MCETKTKNNSIEDQCSHTVIINEPQPYDIHTCTFKKSNNASTNLQSPSFNLKSNMKSTPIRPSQNCKSTCFQTNSNPNLPKTIIEVHNQPSSNESDIQIDTSFHSCH